MLTIRNTQMHALAEGDRREHQRAVTGLIRYKHPEALASVPDAYVANVAGLALNTCESNGFDQRGHVLDFADALVKGDSHPLDSPALEAKVRMVLREFRARELFMRLQAIAGAAAAPAGVDAGNAVSESNEEP